MLSTHEAIAHEAAPAAPPSSGARRRRVALAVAMLVLGLAAFGLPQLGLFGNPGCAFPGSTCTRVLFIGNSYTYVNDLPTTFADLAWSGGHRVETGTLATGGSTLAAHMADPATVSTLASSAWNTVVLQDQSENPALESYRQSEMYPAVTQLVASIRHAGGEPLLFLTWGHETGWPEAGLAGYATMQAALDDGYLGIARRLGVSIAPVGDAWQKVIASQANPELWQGDGTHPTSAGTYLAACVFYAAVFRQSPVGLGYRDGLPSAQASMLQRAAASTVFDDPTKWGLP